MISLFKPNPAKRLDKQYRALQKEAMELQRKGDIQGFALKSEEAEKVAKQIETLNREK